MLGLMEGNSIRRVGTERGSQGDRVYKGHNCIYLYIHLCIKVLTGQVLDAATDWVVQAH